MTVNEIKKELYKQKPTAELLHVDKEGIHYECTLIDGTVIYFSVPSNDIQDAKFYHKMEAQHLNRWINEPAVITDEEFIGMTMDEVVCYGLPTLATNVFGLGEVPPPRT